VGIGVRQVGSLADYVAWRRVRLAVVPGEPAPAVEELRAHAGPQERYFLAELDGVLAGSGFVARADQAGVAVVAPRVLPGCRRRGVGSAVLRRLAGHAAEMGFAVAGAHVSDAGSALFAGRFGFAEVDRQVEQVKVIGDEPAPQPPDGVQIVAVSARPELWRAAYHGVGVPAFADMATAVPVDITLDQWERDFISDPDAMFLALAGGDVIGCAGLMPDADRPGRAEHALTAVRRDWRRRGVACALKRAALAWAAAAGITEVTTWTQRGNDGMRALNTGLGYTTRSETITMHASLPLPRSPAGSAGSSPPPGR